MALRRAVVARMRARRSVRDVAKRMGRSMVCGFRSSVWIFEVFNSSFSQLDDSEA